MLCALCLRDALIYRADFQQPATDSHLDTREGALTETFFWSQQELRVVLVHAHAIDQVRRSRHFIEYLPSQTACEVDAASRLP
jgi:hypothetical protein